MARKSTSGSKAHRWLLPLVLAVAAVTYINPIDGAFVYDDTRQIEDNLLIQERGRVAEALTSDVWEFRAEDGQPGSNYWRPTFVAWMITRLARGGGSEDAVTATIPVKSVPSRAPALSDAEIERLVDEEFARS